MSSETRQSRPRYWCHICNAEVAIYMAPDPTCQQCNEQFIEELQSDDDPREFLAGADHQHTAAENEDVRMPLGSAHFFSYSPNTGRLSNLGGGPNANHPGEMGDEMFQFFTPPPPSRNNNAQDDRERPSTQDNVPPILGNFVQNLLNNMLGQNVDMAAATQMNDGEGGGRGQDGRPVVLFGNMVDGNLSFRSMPGGQTMPGAMPTGTPNPDDPNQDVENTNPGTRNNEDTRGNNINSLLQFLSAMTGGAIDGGLVGNPNDYVFSQTALDNIITQLMEQTGGASAPPPAPEQVIESLAKRPLTDREKSQETDCAVCKDQFEPEEQVIELPCEHIFHDECIKPWLKLNSTCPVCRHSVLPDQQGQNNDNNETGNNNGLDHNTPSNDNDNNDNTARSNSASDENNNANTQGRTSVAWDFSRPGQTSWPLNLSASFPWSEGLARQANNNNANNANNANTVNTANTTNTTNTTSSSTANNENSTHIDEDLDLD